jgi:hypothetical protein
MAEGTPGIGVDAKGGAVIDPTKNVLDLVAAQQKAAEDIRVLESAWRDRWELREREHNKELRDAESQRIDAIREVDVGNVQRAAEVQTGVATALDGKVVAAASAFENRLTATIEPIQRRIDDLTRAQYEAQGQKTQVVETRSAVEDMAPVLAAIATNTTAITELARSRDQATGQKQAVTGIQAFIATGVAVVIATIAVYGFTHNSSSQRCFNAQGAEIVCK